MGMKAILHKWRTRVPRIALLLVASILLLLLWARWGPMDPLFDTPRSTVLLDRHGELLGATVAADGQWRMPPPDSLPARFVRSLLEFEDRRFHRHHGVHLPSLYRAWRQNRRAGRIVSGGSTITMQVARMAGGTGERTHARKLREILLALRLEMRCDKDSILALYTAHAPFGGNVVGLEAAAWRWFGRDPWRLSWAESATLAVLPNAPARIHPGRGRDALKAKRDRLLDRLLHVGAIDSMEHSLAVEEPLPDAPWPLPQRAPHLLATLQRTGYAGHRVHSTLDGKLQDQVTAVGARHASVLAANEVHNAAVLIMEVASGEVLAYLGNLPSAGPAHAAAVDIIRAPRSTGSLLKPFLYAAMLDAGERMPDQLVADVPTRFEGFAPRNFEQRFEGAVPASTALARSLNVPAVRALQEHGVDRALRTLRAMGLHHVDRDAGHYGLALMVGGAESSLWELTGAYASLARTALRDRSDGIGAVHPPQVVQGHVPAKERPRVISAAAAFHTLQALQLGERPDAQAGWRHFGGADVIAWKTGTSHGHRDAWAIGITSGHAVGVWTGNASGEGRPGLTGTLAAAPMLFELFGLLPGGASIDPPHDELMPMAVCRASGHRAGVDCDPVDTLAVIGTALRTATCPYHRRILVNAEGTKRVGPGPDARSVSWFVLPPAMARYRTGAIQGIDALPPWAEDAAAFDADAVMEAINPLPGSRIHVPLLLENTPGAVVLEAAHRDPQARVHWDLDGHWLGTTLGDHHLAADLPEGPHRLTLTDQQGRSIAIPFHVERAAPHRP